MREDKPPRRKRGGQRRLVIAPVFAEIGVAPSPLFEWALLVTLCEHKVTPLAHRSAPSLSVTKSDKETGLPTFPK